MPYMAAPNSAPCGAAAMPVPLPQATPLPMPTPYTMPQPAMMVSPVPPPVVPCSAAGAGLRTTIVTGPDMNGDGIPDVLQGGGGMPMMMPGAAISAPVFGQTGSYVPPPLPVGAGVAPQVIVAPPIVAAPMMSPGSFVPPPVITTGSYVPPPSMPATIITPLQGVLPAPGAGSYVPPPMLPQAAAGPVIMGSSYVPPPGPVVMGSSYVAPPIITTTTGSYVPPPAAIGGSCMLPMSAPIVCGGAGYAPGMVPMGMPQMDAGLAYPRQIPVEVEARVPQEIAVEATVVRKPREVPRPSVPPAAAVPYAAPVVHDRTPLAQERVVGERPLSRSEMAAHGNLVQPSEGYYARPCEAAALPTRAGLAVERVGEPSVIGGGLGTVQTAQYASSINAPTVTTLGGDYSRGGIEGLAGTGLQAYGGGTTITTVTGPDYNRDGIPDILQGGGGYCAGGGMVTVTGPDYNRNGIPDILEQRGGYMAGGYAPGGATVTTVTGPDYNRNGIPDVLEGRQYGGPRIY